MANKKITFYYSEKNKKAFRLPEKYSHHIVLTEEYKEELKTAFLDAKKNKNKKSKKGKKTAKKKKIIDANLIIRITALIVMVASLAVIIDKVYDYYTDIDYDLGQKESFGVVAVPNEVLSKRDTPLYPEIKTENGLPVESLDYPDVYDPMAVAQFGEAYPDFVYYIYMEMGGFVIDYPVVQGADNDYYLRRNMDGEDNISGTLFMDFRNDRETLKGHNIVYGHNMQNGTMFGNLKNYADKKFFYEHDTIYTFSAKEVVAWKIFSAYETTTDNYYIKTTFENDEEYVEFINKLKSDSRHKVDYELTAESDVLTLSTCHNYNNINGRFVIHAVKVAASPLV